MKVAWFQGDIEHPEWGDSIAAPFALSMDAILALPPDDVRRPRLRVLLVPDDFDITELTGDDWDDAPAEANAGLPYHSSLPDGAVWVELHAGDQWPTHVRHRRISRPQGLTG